MCVSYYTHYSMLMIAPGKLFRQGATILCTFPENIQLFLSFLCVFLCITTYISV